MPPESNPDKHHKPFRSASKAYTGFTFGSYDTLPVEKSESFSFGFCFINCLRVSGCSFSQYEHITPPLDNESVRLCFCAIVNGAFPSTDCMKSYFLINPSSPPVRIHLGP